MTRREQRLMALIRAAGLRVVPLGNGPAVMVCGPGVCVLASALAVLGPADLAPFYD